MFYSTNIHKYSPTLQMIMAAVAFVATLAQMPSCKNLSQSIIFLLLVELLIALIWLDFKRASLPLVKNVVPSSPCYQRVYRHFGPGSFPYLPHPTSCLPLGRYNFCLSLQRFPYSLEHVFFAHDIFSFYAQS